ncbi:hypothetical protein KO489_00755 [Reinekea forsetii]|nr:hypothetical protein [Reinekea forsetii]
MQIQSASIPLATPTSKSPVNSGVNANNVGQAENVRLAEQKASARPQTQDRTESPQSTQFAPVSQPTASSEANRTLATNQDGGSESKPINQYQQVAQQTQPQARDNQPGLFGIDVYV